MTMEQEILESFLSDAADWGEKFVGLAFDIADTATPHITIGEIFRGVHSLKGGASFIAADDQRLKCLTDFCHQFETFLDSLRKGNLEMTEPNRTLVAKGLYALNDDIVVLQSGEGIGRHEDLMEAFKGAMRNLVVISEQGNTIVFQLTNNLQHPSDAEMFNRILWKRVRMAAPDTRVVYDLCNAYRLSSMVIGSIIGTLGSVESIAIIRPPSCMKLVFRRFRFEDFGIQVRDSMEECWK